MNQSAMRAGQLALGLLATAALQGCAGMTSRRLVVDRPCVDYSFQIYFDEYSSTLTRAAQRVIADSAAQSRQCKVSAVDVVGLADYKGPPEPNMELSRKRAEIVAQALAKAGFPAPAFQVEAAGDAGAVTAGGKAEPLRRRAEVGIHQSAR